MNQNIIDLDNLLIQFGGDKELINKFLNICIHEIPVRIEKIKQALKNNNFESLKINAHTIKGIAANMRAESLRQAADDIENECRKNKPGIFDMYIAALEHEFGRLESDISKGFLI